MSPHQIQPLVVASCAAQTSRGLVNLAGLIKNQLLQVYFPTMTPSLVIQVRASEAVSGASVPSCFHSWSALNWQWRRFGCGRRAGGGGCSHFCHISEGSKFMKQDDDGRFLLTVLYIFCHRQIISPFGPPLASSPPVLPFGPRPPLPCGPARVVLPLLRFTANEATPASYCLPPSQFPTQSTLNTFFLLRTQISLLIPPSRLVSRLVFLPAGV